MDKIRIIGGKPLNGSIRISGSKNSALPILAATLISDKETLITNIPNLSDIELMIKLLQSLNVKIGFDGKYYSFKAKKPNSLIAPYELVRKMRASFLLLGPLIAKYGYAKVSLPGGCAIGIRPVDLHIRGLEKMGVKFRIEDGYVKGEVRGKLKGAEITFPRISVGATENILIAAVLADGITTIKNAAREPEIVDLANFLISLGAEIKGHGTNKISIKGKKKLGGCEYKVMPDRIEAGTYALSIFGCSGKVLLENVSKELSNHLMSIFSSIKSLEFKVMDNFNKLEVTKLDNRGLSLDISTTEYPGFPTDLQAQLTAALLKTNGCSLLKENIFENRFMHISELKRMGANLILNGATVKINGVDEIYGAEVMATDLRASSSLVIAGLMAKGETLINRVYHLDRGYESIEKKLKSCGASIERIQV